MWPVERSTLNFPFVVINDEDIDFSSMEKDFRHDSPLDASLDPVENNIQYGQIVHNSSVDDTPLSVIFGDKEQRQGSSSCYQNPLDSATSEIFEPIPLKELSQASEGQQTISDDEDDVAVEAFPDDETCTCQYEAPQISPAQPSYMELTASPLVSDVSIGVVSLSNDDFVDSFPIAEENHRDVSEKEIEDVLSDDSTYFKDYDFKGKTNRFRDYQTVQWEKRYKELRQIYHDTGRSAVHHADASRKGLARWVKRQRAQYKLLQEGKPSSMTDERIQALNLINFVWDSHNTVWEDRVLELQAFRAKHNHCNVTSSNYPAGGTLVSWVKSQRRQYRIMKEGKKSNLTPKRIQQLENLGFQF